MESASNIPATNAPAKGGRLVAVAVVLVIVGIVAVLGLAFRRDPHDIRTDGQGRIRLEDYRGRTVILNFWASWCIPCKQENPALAAVWERYRTSEVVLIGIVYEDTPEAAREYTERLGNTWPSGVDADGRTGIAYGVFGIPETFFIGPDGVIAGRHIGPIDQETLITGIEAMRGRR